MTAGKQLGMFPLKEGKMLEKDIERKVCKYAKVLGIEPYKFSSPARAAVPDRMFVFEGLVFFIEFKRKGYKPTSAQHREINRLRNHGVPVFVIDSIETGKYVMDLVHRGVHPDKISGSGLK
jgi:hypothetical protein